MNHTSKASIAESALYSVGIREFFNEASAEADAEGAFKYLAERAKGEAINDLARDCFDNSANHGFWDTDQEGVQMFGDERVKTVPEKLALIHSEVSEALECYRDSQMLTTFSESGKPEGFPSELADVIIRTFDLAIALNINILSEIQKKMAYNASRPRKHGKIC